jgi:hypothetical protein
VASVVQLKIGLDATDLKDALRAHHPAYFQAGMQWTCLEEWMNIDLLAVECWRQARVIGYEVKVSRGDYRAELLDPTKRMEAVSRCTQFYIAVPSGLLKPEEIAFVEPDWSLEDFKRARCTNPDCSERRERHGWHKRQPKPRGNKRRGTDDEGVTISFGYGRDVGVDEHGVTYSSRYHRDACCVTCKGYGTVDRSVVEEQAPTLWVPKDVGLVEVDGRGVRVIKQAPKNVLPKPIIGGSAPQSEHENRLMRAGLAQLVRWSSARPDPRHRGHGGRID